MSRAMIRSTWVVLWATSDPALLGVSLYWQALSGNPLFLGNLETTTFGAR